MVCGTQHAVPAGSRGARKAFRGDILDIHDPDDDAKSVDSIFGWAQGLRVAMHASLTRSIALCTIGCC